MHCALLARLAVGQSPISMKEPRPIRSFRTLYKIVSKMIMRPLLTKLVSPTQASFVPGRHIADNIVVAQEIPKKFRVSKALLSESYLFVRDGSLLSYLKMAPVCLICADDLILFSGASMDQADAMRDCLDSFCLSGG